MTSKRTISISEARKRIFDIAEEVQKPNHYYTFTENGKPKAVLMSADEFDSLMEDYELLCDPGFQKRIQQAEEEYRRGDYVTLDELEKELGYVKDRASLVRENSKKPYRASRISRRRRV